MKKHELHLQFTKARERKVLLYRALSIYPFEKKEMTASKIVRFYNESKSEVDIIDQMAKKVKMKTRLGS